MNNLNIIKALKESIDKENWYAALFVALTIPDIFGNIDKPNSSVGKRYIEWYNTYVKTNNSFLTGANCYALRCAALHEGKQNISGQYAKDSDDILNDFEFIFPLKGIMIHNNRKGDKLQLQVDKICEEILFGAEKYIATKGACIKDELVLKELDWSKSFSIF